MMNKVLIEMLFLALALTQPQATRAEVNVSIGIDLPALVYSGGPPEVIVLPDTENVYVVPDRDFDMFFWNGWWWRSWEGRWYRSHSYNRGWSHYNNVPSFYYDVDPEWRTYYHERNWSGHRWNYERIPPQRLKNNWKKWHSDQYWQRNRTWNVEHYQPRQQHELRGLRKQRQERYQQQLHKQNRQQPQAQEQPREVRERKQQPHAAQQQQQTQQLHKKKHQRPQVQEHPREIKERKRQPHTPQQQQQSKEQKKRSKKHEQGQQKSHAEDAGKHGNERN
ncbi:MAG: hypothetical protein PHI97_18980 [Desulfobulbus sp.]|nr:hypothetical protein [Desulfobulbus sp.]